MGGVLAQTIFAAAKEQGVIVPPQLPHDVLFYTAGELTRRELMAHGIDYTHFAQWHLRQHVWNWLSGQMAVHWTHHLEGTRSPAESLSELVAAFK